MRLGRLAVSDGHLVAGGEVVAAQVPEGEFAPLVNVGRERGAGRAVGNRDGQGRPGGPLEAPDRVVERVDVEERTGRVASVLGCADESGWKTGAGGRPGRCSLIALASRDAQASGKENDRHAGRQHDKGVNGTPATGRRTGTTSDPAWHVALPSIGGAQPSLREESRRADKRGIGLPQRAPSGCCGCPEATSIARGVPEEGWRRSPSSRHTSEDPDRRPGACTSSCASTRRRGSSLRRGPPPARAHHGRRLREAARRRTGAEGRQRRWQALPNLATNVDRRGVRPIRLTNESRGARSRASASAPGVGASCAPDARRLAPRGVTVTKGEP